MGFIHIILGIYGGGDVPVVSREYTRIGTLVGATREIGTLLGATRAVGTLVGATREIGTLRGNDRR